LGGGCFAREIHPGKCPVRRKRKKRKIRIKREEAREL